MFGIAIATVILPSLSRQHAARTTEVFSRTLDWALRMVLLVAIPAAVALMILAEPILTTLFYYGDVMTPRGIGMATISLQAYAIGLIAFMLISKVLAPGYFARQDMKTPVRIGIIALVANMVLNLAFALPLHRVSSASGMSGWRRRLRWRRRVTDAGLLFRGLYGLGIYRPAPGWPRFLLTLLGANLVMAVVLWGFTAYLNQWLFWDGWQRVGWMLLICLSGTLVYTLFLLAGGMPALRPSAITSGAVTRCWPGGASPVFPLLGWAILPPLFCDESRQRLQTSDPEPVTGKKHQFIRGLQQSASGTSRLMSRRLDRLTAFISVIGPFCNSCVNKQQYTTCLLW